MHPIFYDERAEVPLVKGGINALFAVKCCVEHNRWTEFLDCRVCRDAVCPNMGRSLFLSFVLIVEDIYEWLIALGPQPQKC